MSEAGSYNPDDLMNDQLVAYLDGELDSENSLKVERRLAEDEEFRQQLQQLQRAWDMLDEIPRSEVSNSFTQTTVEMVVLSAEHELLEREGLAQRRKYSRWLLGVSGFAVTVLASYWLIAAVLARPNEKLLEDLPVIENIELYRHVDSVEYLRELEASGLFDEEAEDAL